MAKVEIYTRWDCGYCTRAKALLDAKRVDYIEYDTTMDSKKRIEMVERKPDAQTLPQIFIDGVAYGGCDDIQALDRAGKLDVALGLA